MFSRRERLPRAQFSTTLKAGRRLSSPNFIIVVSREAKGYAVVIPKKVARLSVTRHKMKRKVMRALKDLTLPASLVVFPRASVSGVEYTEMKAELQNLLSKIT